jgi:hypothetical protein
LLRASLALLAGLLAASAQQQSLADQAVESMLNSLSVSSTQLSSGMTAETTAAAVLDVLTSVQPGTTLSPASQSAALSVLTAVTSAPLDVTSDAAQSVVAALSIVASSSFITAAASGNASALVQVQSVLDSLASAQASSLLAALASLAPGAPPPAPSTAWSRTIQMLVQVDPPGSARLTSAPITAPGSPSSFDPLPAGLLSGVTGPVVTTFYSLGFDPYGGSRRASGSTTGVTRLALSNPDGSPIAVANASTPITFTLPYVFTGTSGSAQCMFWDVGAGAYSSRGCVTLPSRAPPGHTLAFTPGFVAPSDASLALAWNISGPLTAGCSVTLLDCNAAVTPAAVFPDPANVASVACPLPTSGAGAGAQPALRVYRGRNCMLRKEGNSLGCAWSNVQQAFIGDGCVATGAATQCMCRHVRALPRGMRALRAPPARHELAH